MYTSSRNLLQNIATSKFTSFVVSFFEAAFVSEPSVTQTNKEHHTDLNMSIQQAIITIITC